jgi:two-component system NtrC family sensor kinase
MPSGHLPDLAASSALVAMLTDTGRPILGQQIKNDRYGRYSAAVRDEVERLRAEVVLPMRFKNRLNGLLVLGQKRSGDLYSKEDLDLLETLCHQSALAVENTRAYQALQTLNQSLETKVAERTRDLAAALKEKERTQEQLIRSESLAALGQLVAGVAHELNNPLASVTSLLQSVREDFENWESDQLPDQDLIDDLQFADKELARAKTIVASLLGLARQTQTYEEAVDMNLVVRDALQVLYNRYKHNRVTLNQNLQPELPTLRGNFANLGQVVLNIIQNAFQAIADGEGRIDLGTEYDPRRRQVLFYCRDNGPGIDPALRKDVFKPFFTTKPVGQGTGLGLYICHEIISRHSGSIEIASHNNEGTLVTVCLPVNSDQPPI